VKKRAREKGEGKRERSGERKRERTCVSDDSFLEFTANKLLFSSPSLIVSFVFL
jgi:hypothetical protein